MGVLLPWQREKQTGKGNKRLGARAKSGATKTAEAPKRPVSKMLLVVLLVLSLPCMILVVLAKGRHHSVDLQELWALKGSRLIQASNGLYAVANGESLSVYDRSGLKTFIGEETTQATLAGDALAFVKQGVLSVVGLGGDEREIASLAPGEYLVPCDASLIVTAKPANGLKFGEPWLIRAFAAEGKAIWQRQMGAAPFWVYQYGDVLMMAAYDISAGCIPAVFSINTLTGGVLWTSTMERGIFREIHTLGERVLVVLDKGIRCLNKDGDTVWTYESKGAITASSVWRDTLFVAEWMSGAQGLLGAISPGRLSAFSREGNLLWSRSIREMVFQIEEGEYLSRDPNEGYIVALSGSRMIGLSTRTGKKVIDYAPEGKPLCIWRGDALQQINGDLRLYSLSLR